MLAVLASAILAMLATASQGLRARKDAFFAIEHAC